ncbi:MAG: hypothetical protein EXR58_01895 [Chloroflexi bacterium]|nr:hypothetical protein [Chloroflexota bacterium]
MAGRQQDVAAALRGPAQIRRSRVAEDVYLFYGGERPGRWLCVVVKVVDGYGFVITCYLTDAIKIGAPVWTR